MQKKSSQNRWNRNQLQEIEQSLQDEGLIFELDNPAQELLLEHLQSDPIGRLLQIIASLPEVRQEKVLRARREIAENSPEMERRLDVAMDRVLEELIIDE
ncbi:MAG TPA: hypothetical protein PLX18_01580 [Anaerohalosphaeraceae bacterium]|jgi:hypothetical protein|nr:hypothetical protein [Anaerohalosphaeraceae bacterium]HOT74036.1 hypothetical protein [Anaerohalosphaeraceae bacterium]HPB93753.1 hypothetical protein [Anaerohalosphaeraceae bacterium]HQG04632.1 hypothetical protein [Anaerohalosphaeraceae bacterium]HQI06538.1 hypothetical protein [Anaerohalosphaeraceae bacterium]